MAIVDPWGALLEQLLEVPAEDDKATGGRRRGKQEQGGGGPIVARTPTTQSIPEDRRQALAELDAVIERAEGTRTRYLVHVEELTAAGRDATPAQAMLRQAEDHLVRLHESRAVLLSGQLPELGDEDG